MSDQEPSDLSTESDDPVVVYRTSALHEADMVAEAMGRARIPFSRRVETLGGLSAAMPASPPPGLLPGNFWAIAVPGSCADRAVRSVATLPVSREFPASHEMPGVKEIFRGGTWIFVLAIILALAWALFRILPG